VLADRLDALVRSEIVRKNGDPTHAQKAIYSLTAKGVDLLPILTAMSAWSQKYYPTTRRAEAVRFIRGGAKTQRQLESRLREDHAVG
jgi:DNA-binding HxlR family transcriptional regulator